MSKLGNAISMLNLLSTGKKYSVSELASILEVSERMIRLYKEDFEKAGIYSPYMRHWNTGVLWNAESRWKT